MGYDENLTAAQRLLAATIPLTIRKVNYADRVQAVRMVLVLLPKEKTRRYFEEHWFPMYDEESGGVEEVSDIPYIAELVSQEVLPIHVRADMYQILRGMVSQFHKLPSPNAQTAP
jgi:hypothetical protein